MLKKLALASLFFLAARANALTPPSGIFVGEPFTDSEFGTTIRRLSNNFPKTGSAMIYNKNGFWTADGTLYLHDIEQGFINVIDRQKRAILNC